MMTIPDSTTMTDPLIISYRSKPPILLATDKTGYTGSAVDFAINQASFGDTPLIITYFAVPNDVNPFNGKTGPVSDEWRKQGRSVLNELEEKARMSGVENIQTVLEESPMSETLPELASKLGAGLIVFSSQQFGY
jgi:hypothetical protein